MPQFPLQLLVNYWENVSANKKKEMSQDGFPQRLTLEEGNKWWDKEIGWEEWERRENKEKNDKGR